MLPDVEPVFLADTLFSALCQEALSVPGGIDKLYKKCVSGSIRFSDALPFIQGEFYVPKPAMTIQTDQEGDSRTKKAFKKLKYIPVTIHSRFMGIANRAV